MGDNVGAIALGVAGLALGPTALFGVGALAAAGAGAAAGSLLIDQPKTAKRAAAHSEEQLRQQQRVQRSQQALSEAKNVRDRLTQLRNERQQRAGNLVRAINLGGAEGTQLESSSAPSGAMGSITSQTRTNIGTINSTELTGRDIFRFNEATTSARIAEQDALQDLNMAKTVGGLSSTIFSMGGGFKSIFSQTPEAPNNFVDTASPSYELMSGAVPFYTGG
jgi:hypothetical protein